MARKPSLKKQLEALADRFVPDVRRAFVASIRDVSETAMLTAIIDAIREGDLEKAFRATGLSPAAMRPVTAMIEQAFEAGGVTVSNSLPNLNTAAGPTIFRFDVRNSRAEAYLRDQSSGLVTRINEQTRTNIQTMVQAGMRDGRNPRNVALDIIGRVDPTTGRRTGGIVGLTDQQARWVANARRELSGVPDASYFTRERRDKRFDGIVQRAIRDGKPLDAGKVDALVGRYSDSLLQLRGETIARTEMLQALARSQDEAIRQAIDTGTVNPRNVTKKWDATGDKRTRPSHMAMDGQSVGMDEAFTTPDGAKLMIPGDGSLGAPASETINCFAPWSRIAVAGLHRVIRSQYVGQLVEISIGLGENTTVTANHPILTERGWIVAGQLVEGDNLVYSGFIDRFAVFGPDKQNVEPTAQELYRAGELAGLAERVSREVVNFHGHIPAQDIDVVTIPSELRCAFQSPRAQSFSHFSFSETDIKSGLLMFDRATLLADPVASSIAARFGGFVRSLFASFNRQLRGSTSITFGIIRGLKASILQNGIDHCATDTQCFSHCIDAVTSVEQLVHNGNERSADARVSCFGALSRVFVRDQVCVRNDTLNNRNSDIGFLNNVGDVLSLAVQSQNDFGILRTEFLPTSLVPVTILPNNSCVRDGSVNERITDFKHFGSFQNGFSGSVNINSLSRVKVSIRSVTKVRFSHYEGPVYNFETLNGLVVTDGILSHNCRCRVDYDIDFLAGLEGEYD